MTATRQSHQIHCFGAVTLVWFGDQLPTERDVRKYTEKRRVGSEYSPLRPQVQCENHKFLYPRTREKKISLKFDLLSQNSILGCLWHGSFSQVSRVWYTLLSRELWMFSVPNHSYRKNVFAFIYWGAFIHTHTHKWERERTNHLQCSQLPTSRADLGKSKLLGIQFRSLRWIILGTHLLELSCAFEVKLGCRHRH